MGKFRLSGTVSPRTYAEVYTSGKCIELPSLLEVGVTAGSAFHSCVAHCMLVLKPFSFQVSFLYEKKK